MEAIQKPQAPMPMPLPARGCSVRLHVGSIELVLESIRGGYSLLCLDGTEVRSWMLGLPASGAMHIEFRAPRTPLILNFSLSVALAPGGRVRGYAQAPLIPTLVFADGERHFVVTEILPLELLTEWDASALCCLQRWPSPLTYRLPPNGSALRAIVPLTLYNRSDTMQSLAQVQVQLHCSELRSLRGHTIAAPRRLAVGPDGAIHTHVQSNSWAAAR
ncbi:MAG: hypothetical protein WCR59_01165 [Planctomycetota bacterium]|jgi:hypothetical protein